MNWLCFIFLSVLWIAGSAGSPSALANPDPAVMAAECELMGCWSSTFPEIFRLSADAADAVNDYVTNFQVHRGEIQRIQAQTPDEQAVKLSYELELLRQALEECQDLARGPSFPRHLILVGKHFDADGDNFRLAAETRKNELFQQYCAPLPTQEEQRRCLSQIVIKADLDKDSLLHYLRMLGPGSIPSLIYLGHGMTDGLTVGSKNLILPTAWSAQLKISEAEWRSKNRSVFYTRDLDGSFDITSRLAPNAEIELQACHTGEQFAKRLKRLAGPQRRIFSSVPGMYFLYWDKTSQNWVSPGNQPVPAGHDAVLQTGNQYLSSGGIRESETTEEMGALPPISEPTQEEIEEAKTTSRPRDLAARSVVLRLVLGSGDRAILESLGKTILFTPTEQAFLRTLFLGKVDQDHDRWKESDSEDFGSRHIRRAIRSSQSSLAPRILEKLETCIQASATEFYRP